MSRLALTAAVTAFLSLTLPLAADQLADDLRAAYDAGNLPGLHGVLVQKDGVTQAEIYFQGNDQVWGTPIGNRSHGPDTLHDLRSISKSVVALLYGIALEEGLVPPPEALLMEQFPECSDVATPGHMEITIEDVLIMRMGLAWDETLPYSDPQNSEIAMERAEDRIRFILDRPVTGTPGETFVYSGGATALLGELIARGSGQPLDVFARERLFDPLGIARYEWLRGADGRVAAASGLRLSARGLAKIGQLVANDGRVDETQLVTAEWLDRMLTPRVTVGGLRYGYQWWLSPADAPEWAAALGNGGQRLTIVEPIGLVTVIQAGNYNLPEDWQVPATVITQYVIPSMGLR